MPDSTGHKINEPVRRSINRKNFVDAMAALTDLSPFPFYGTLLGLVREKNIIKNDDDVDFYINISHREDAVVRLARAGFSIDLERQPNTTPFFLQANRMIDGVNSFVDLYFYEDLYDNPFVTDRWNYFGMPERQENHLRVPKYLLFPLKKATIFGVRVWMPARPKQCVRFLYGKSWKKKLGKTQGDYEMTMLENEPLSIIPGSNNHRLYKRLRVQIYFTNVANENAERLQQRISALDAELARAHARAQELEGALSEVGRLVGIDDDASVPLDADRRVASIKEKLVTGLRHKPAAGKGQGLRRRSPANARDEIEADGEGTSGRETSRFSKANETPP